VTSHAAARYVVEADGGARGNPGPAGYGAVVKDPSGAVVAEVAESIGVATNNVAEYRGLIAGLTALTDAVGAAGVPVEVRMDSKLVIEQMSGRWKVKHENIRPLAAQAAALARRHQVTWRWIPRAENAHADRLANEAMDAAARGEDWLSATAAVDRPAAGARKSAAAGKADEPPAGRARGAAAERAEAPSAGRTGGPAREAAAERAEALEPGRTGGAARETAAGRADAREAGRTGGTAREAAAGKAGAPEAGRAGGEAAGRADAPPTGRTHGAAAPSGPAREPEATARPEAAPARPGTAATRPGAAATRPGGTAGTDLTDTATVSGRPAGTGWMPRPTRAATTLLLLRHGETPLSVEKRFSGVGDPVLTARGAAQAEAAAVRLSREPYRIDVIVSSPLKRALQTAEAVAARTGLGVTVEEGLRETDFGAWEGHTFAEIQERWPDLLTAWLADPAVAPPGGESFEQAAHRVEAAVSRIIARHQGKTVLVVTHVTPIKTILRLALLAPPAALHRMHLDIACLNAVDYYADGPAVVRSVNDTSHLR